MRKAGGAHHHQLPVGREAHIGEEGDDDFGDFDDGLQQGEDDAETSFDKPPEQPPVPVPSPGPVSRSNSSPHILLPCPPAMVIV